MAVPLSHLEISLVEASTHYCSICKGVLILYTSPPIYNNDDGKIFWTRKRTLYCSNCDFVPMEIMQPEPLEN